MTKQEADFIGSMNMCDEISAEAYKKIMCHCEVEESQPCEDCRNCKKWESCPCGKEGHDNGTSIGYSIGECKEYEQQPCEDYLKMRKGDYVHYNVEWFLKNWEMELEILSGGKIKPCEDCISRQDLIGTMHVIMDDAIIGNEDENYECLDDIKQQYIEIAKGMKSVQPKPIFYPPCEDCNTKMDKIRRAYDKCRWIPCSEKNPNETGEYLTTIKFLNRENVYSYMVVKRDYYADMDTWNDSLVIAWMPLPEPYKAESDKESE